MMDGVISGSTRKAIVVGGGIGGAAAAVALNRRGWEVEVLERAPSFAELGAGLSLWPNALRALDALGLGEPVRARALVEAEAGIRRSSGAWLARTDLEELGRRFGALTMIHRADLHQALLAAVPAGALRSGVAVEAVEPGPESAAVTHRSGSESADLVVGADGIGSAVRRALWPRGPQPRYAGYTAWRLIAPALEKPCGGAESWGRGERFGFAPLADGRVYAFATASVAAGGSAADGELAELRRRFGRWHAPIPEILEGADEGAVLRHDIEELPPLPSFVGGRVALVGDAAHAMTPNLGQGACQALEDAVVLAALLDSHDRVDDALAAYDAVRRPRTEGIAARSRRIGRVAQWRSPPAVMLRDGLMRVAPASSQLRSLAPILEWEPPGGSGGRDAVRRPQSAQ
jgi:2-polyprenyl-6-methoxyphenol hydroxylase-like FAD-dependent oxidoreductase